ncbi:putative T7SS-secreted protein [Streptomyces sp. NPDC053720]|uniref:putative T7SS-secreted protein n=1 Tax=Streptomyces sp. NPDC053720 TaxID=3154855 RepID=UPI00343D913E
MPDWGAWAEKGLGKLEDGWEEGKKKVGEGVDWATDKVGDGLEYIDQGTMADIVEDWGDRAASSLGAKVGEQQLGQCEEANELVHGNVTKISASVQNLRDFKSAFDLVGRGLKGLDSSRWRGVAADTFREKFTTVPTNWMRASDAFDEAARALETYATTVTWAQGKARDAIELYRTGQQTSRSAVTAYNKEVDAYKEAYGGKDPLPRPGEFVDPGTAQRDRAQEILADARGQRDEAAGTAQKLVAAALEHAPPMPSATERARFNLADFAVGQGVEATHFTGGVVKGTVGITNFVRSIDPHDPYNLTHPAEYYKSVNMTLAGLASTAAHPDRALKAAWESVKADPSEFAGRMLPEFAGTKGAGGGKSLLRAGVKDGLKEGAESPVRTGVHDPAKASKPHKSAEMDPTDPVDLATGTMYLPQTDIALPGVLPLVFRRRVASGYRAGIWFGPSWSSTADQRLEIDPEGVVFVCEDGLLLPYPHPAPGVPVMPSHGPRWPLDLDVHGDYTVTEPETGRIRHFSPRRANLALLTQIDDRNGNWITFGYDESGAPFEIVHGAGYHMKLTTAEGRITALHLAAAGPDGADQEILRYGYTAGHLTEVINSSGLPLRFTYDERSRITSWTDTNGSSYSYTYDDQDRCVAEGGAAGHMALRLDYDSTDLETGSRVTTATSSGGAVHKYVINDSHQVVAEIDPLGAVTRFERDRYNRLLSRTDPLGRTLLLRYDDVGNLTSVVRPDGRESTAEYNAMGLPVRVTNPDRTSMIQEYDARGNRTAITDPAGATTRYTYDEAGHLTAVNDALGHTTHIRCNATGLPVEITDPLGAVTRYERDGFGRPVAVTDALGATVRVEWTPEGRMSRRTEPDGTSHSWVYDGEGNCVTHTDATGARSSFEYTHFDLMSARTGPDGVRYEFGHDTELRLTQVLNPQGLTWNYAYNKAGRLISETDFDGRTLTYDHDAAGRLTARTDALGQTIRYERDELDRVTTKNANGSVTTFAYNLSDQLAGAIGPDATITYLHDRFGRLRSETVNGRTLTFGHDELGRRNSRTTPAGAVSSWTYDAAGRRDTLATSGRTLTFEYDATGQELVRHIGQTVTLASRYDTRGRLATQHTTTADRTVQRRDYTYRADGNLIGIDDHLSGPRRFDLDAAGRVTAVHATGWTERYAYDETGNQTDASWPASHPGQEAVGPRTYAGTTLTRAGNVRYEHDALGRITLRQKTRLSRKPDTWRYEWDAEDRLTAVTTPDGTRWRYAYDPLGRRISKKRMAADSETVEEQTVFVWDGTTLCEQTTGSAQLPNPVTLTWDHDGLRPLTQTERITSADVPQTEIDDRFFSIVTDLIGSPTELVDEQGDIAWRTRTTLWGTTTWNTNATTHTPLRFPGQYFDPETDLHYNFHRYYDPETARYLSQDPLGLAPTPNPASYVRNPHTWSDSLGLAPDCDEPKRGKFEFRKPNPDFPPDPQAVDAMRSAPVGGNVDCSELAEHILKRADGKGKIINFTAYGDPEIRIPQNGGQMSADFRYHDVYTDGRYVYDPEMGVDPISYGDYERAIRLENPGKKLVVTNGGYSGPLW